MDDIRSLLWDERSKSLPLSQMIVDDAFDGGDRPGLASVATLVPWDRHPVLGFSPFRIPKASSDAALSALAIVESSLSGLIGLVRDASALEGIFRVLPHVLEAKGISEGIDEG